MGMVGLTPDDLAMSRTTTNDDDSSSLQTILLFAIIFIISSVPIAFLIYETQREQTEKTTACLQGLGYTAAQCEFMISTKGPVETCQGLFDYSEEQCTFITSRDEGVEDCMRLFKHTQEQCTLLTRIKHKPIPTL